MTITVEHELRALEAAMTECRRRLAYSRAENDDLNRDLLVADLNLMLDRWTQLQLAPEDTEDTHE